MEIILAALAGIFFGSTVILGIQAGTKKKEEPQEQVAKEQQEIIKQQQIVTGKHCQINPIFR